MTAKVEQNFPPPMVNWVADQKKKKKEKEKIKKEKDK